MQKLEKLIEVFSKLQGIGKKSATKLAFDILSKDKSEIDRLIFVLSDAYNSIKECSICHSLSEDDVCEVCSDNLRDQNIICVVESYRDVLAFENSKAYNGVYHVLGGVIDPLNGIGVHDLNIDSLISRLDNGKEIILALNKSEYGDSTSLYLIEILKEYDVKVTRIATGIPLGANIENIDSDTLNLSLETRKTVKE